MGNLISGNHLSNCRMHVKKRAKLSRVLEKKPGALRHGAPFQAWDLPVSIQVLRDRILKQDRGDRAFVDLLLMARSLEDRGLETLEVACDLTL